jgi:hypothetical protein
MTQTGGTCLAIKIRLEDGDILLVTDKDEILPWAPKTTWFGASICSWG